MRRYHLQDRDDYHKYNKLCGSLRSYAHRLTLLPALDPFRTRSELALLNKLHDLGLLSSSTSAAAAASAPAGKAWAAGDEVLAKYSGDGQWYPARIASVGGSADNRVYSVVFKGYNTTELVNAAQIKALPAGYTAPAPAAGSKRKLTKAEEEERERKKKKNEKKVEAKAQKAKEQAGKQATWQKFAKKSEKKGIHIAGVAGTSIFKTPDNPLGRGKSLCTCWAACGARFLRVRSALWRWC